MKILAPTLLFFLKNLAFTRGQCVGAPTTPCETLLGPRTCGTACDSSGCSGSLEFCDFACTQPGCFCDLDIQGQCSFNPLLQGEAIVSCKGTPTRCTLLGSEASCLQVIGCVWEGPPGLPDEPGTCVGSGDTSCSQYADNQCLTDAECTIDLAACQNACTHPGCSCSVDDVTSSFRASSKVVTCDGTPNSCANIDDSISCGNAVNCVWVPEPPTQAPVSNIIPDGICRGTPSANSCATLYPPFAYRECQGLPPTQYSVCVNSCEAIPGCKCNTNQGVCGSVTNEVSTLSCAGTPKVCAEFLSISECIAAPGCRWDAFIGAEPTRTPTSNIEPEPSPPVPVPVPVPAPLPTRRPTPAPTVNSPPTICGPKPVFAPTAACP